MNKVYDGNFINIAYQMIDNKQLCNLLILNLDNIKYENDEIYTQQIKDILSISSYIINNGSNIIIIGNDKIKDVDLDLILRKELLWDKQRTIIYSNGLKPNKILASGYSYIFWYSNNYRPNDPIPICNNFDNGIELSDFWDINTDINQRIIKMFSNENDIVLELYRNNEIISQYCETLNRNYIGFKNNE